MVLKSSEDKTDGFIVGGKVDHVRKVRGKETFSFVFPCANDDRDRCVARTREGAVMCCLLALHYPG